VKHICHQYVVIVACICMQWWLEVGHMLLHTDSKQVTIIQLLSATDAVTNCLRAVLCLLVALCSNGLFVINKVALHWARLVLGWVTVCGQVNDLGT